MVRKHSEALFNFLFPTFSAATWEHIRRRIGWRGHQHLPRLLQTHCLQLVLSQPGLLPALAVHLQAQPSLPLLHPRQGAFDWGEWGHWAVLQRLCRARMGGKWVGFLYVYLSKYIYNIYIYNYTYIHTYMHALHYITLHYTTLHYITLHYNYITFTLHYNYITITLHLHYMTLHLHYITLHYIHTSYVRTYVRTYVHTYLHTYLHTYIHTYIHNITSHNITLHYIILHYITYIHIYVYLHCMYLWVSGTPGP